MIKFPSRLFLYAACIGSSIGITNAQTSISVSIPVDTSANWSLNGINYTGSTASPINGSANNTGSISNIIGTGLYQFVINSQSVTPAQSNTNPFPDPPPTTLTWSIQGDGNLSGQSPAFQMQSTGGPSTPILNYTAGLYANNGSNLTLNSVGQSASVNLSQSNNIFSAYNLISTGGAGSSYNSVSAAGQNWWQAPYSAYGLNGGDVNLTISDLTNAENPLTISVSGTSSLSQTLPWLIQTGGVIASSVGGSANAFQYVIDKGTDNAVGNGGNGGNVSVNIGPNVNIALGSPTSLLNTSAAMPVAGIVATSIGSPGGVCCIYGAGVTLDTIVPAGEDYIYLTYGQNGSGGTVDVGLSGSIFGSSPNLYGIIASSVGASTQIPVSLQTSLSPVAASGLGGNVSVQLTGGSINLSEFNSVGIFASSLANQVIIPTDLKVSGSGNSAGTVQVSIDSNSSISVGSSNQLTAGQMSAGIVAVSSTGWLFQPVGSPVAGAASAGNGGNVTVSNAGTISSFGGSAFGIVGLSLGNGGVLSNAPSSLSNIQYFGLPSSSPTQSNNGGTIAITNSGSITTIGNAAIGVLAASNGSGGVVVKIPNATFSNPSLNNNNIIIGTASTGFVAGANAATFSASGGSVNITNTGSIQTNGVVAGGILAQSIGGGGASLTEGVALFAGDAGGSGGAGGSISFTNSGTVSTIGDASIGFLGQSIGGGGGHAANTAGLFVALGGQGGAGGSGGSVSVTLEPGSQFLTQGDFSYAALLQSIGGGGGNGGFAKSYGVFASTGIGGIGGSGGPGGSIALYSSTTGNNLPTSTTGNQSHGLFLQSIGGGGGAGGHAYSFTTGVAFAGAVALGGTGGTAGAGGNITVNSTSTSPWGFAANISTTGTDSMGLLMQSIGGGGGYGGGALSQAFGLSGIPEVPTISFATSVGGSGSTGSNGGNINATINTAITTQGTGSHAVFAQSIGGGGGAGADSTAGGNSFNISEFTFTGSVGMGGNGGGGGNGGAVNVTSNYSVASSYNLSTIGHNASGIFAQSIGGGGGYGAVGNASQSSVSLGEYRTGLSFSLGGMGGAGGAGGPVSIFNQSNITTVGSQSSGILAQSISGGGGYAGNAGAQGAGGDLWASIAVGGSGGGGQAGGSIAINNSGSIVTGMQLDLASSNVNSMNLTQPIAIGGDSHAIIAQSIGGGGGIGGNADPSAALIGSVQSLLSSGAADYVDGTGTGTYFMSPGGSQPSPNLPVNLNTTISAGGNGGLGGSGGSITISNAAPITTLGHRSYGIFAQSVGGGGGIAGSAAPDSAFLSAQAGITILSGFTLGLGINVGGSGGSGGDGGTINLNLYGSAAKGAMPLVTTTGYASHGVIAQSIGGGGGAGHEGSIFNFQSPDGLSPSIVVNPKFNIGSMSTKTGMQGLGGAIWLGTAASISPGGIAGASQTIASGTIVTMGDAASGVFLQSIGGGGGLASFSCSNSGNAAVSSGQTGFSPSLTASACLHNTNTVAIPGATSTSFTPAFFQQSNNAQLVQVNILSSSGTGANSLGGPINIFSENTIITQGNRSIGLVAQSIGGGGGFISAPAQSLSAANLPTAGNNLSPGGSINISLQSWANGGIFTSGNGAWGLLAQSIGGGGGFIGDPSFSLDTVPAANNTAATQSSGPANGGNITVTLGQPFQPQNPLPPNIFTTGDNAHGLVVQSIGGGGGIANSGKPIVGSTSIASPQNYGAGGSIQITTYGNITTYGQNAVGIFAQSSGNLASSGPIAINLNGSITTLQSYNSVTNEIIPSSAAIVISGGSNDANNPNTITIGSTGQILSNGNAEYITGIMTDYGYTNVINNGSLAGSVNLGANPGELTNNGNFYAGANIVVSNNSLHNYGFMSIGALRSISRTNMIGRFYQHESGRLAVSIDSLRPVKNDYLNVNGAAIVEGSIRPLARSLLPGPVRFLSATSLVSSAAVTDTHVFDWSLTTSGNELVMTPAQRFSPAGFALTPNQQSLAAYLSRAWNNSDASLAQVFGYLHEVPYGENANYQGILNQLSGQVLNSQAIQMKTAFVSALSYGMSCPLLNTRVGDMKETDCTWGFVSGNLSDQSSNASNSGYSATTGAVRFGAQKSFGADYSTGFAVGYSTNKLTSTGFSSSGNMLDLSVSASKSINQWSFGTSLAYAQGWFNNSRTPQLFGIGIADKLSSSYASNSGMYGLGWRVRSAYSFQFQNYYIKPYVDLDLIYTKQPGYAETSGILALWTSGSDQLNFAATPMIEIGGNLPFSDTMTVRGYLSAGASFLPNNKISTQMRFTSALDANGSFNVITNGPTAFGIVKAGLQAFQNDSFEVRAEYGLQAGQGYLSQSLGANLIYRF